MQPSILIAVNAICSLFLLVIGIKLKVRGLKEEKPVKP